MTRKTFTEVLAATRQAFIENLTLQAHYGYDITLSWDEIFSKVSFEGILTYVFSYLVWVFGADIADTADEITSTISTEHEFSIPWYRDVALAFQLGDELVFNESTYKYDYALIDATKQIIKYCQVRKRLVSGVTTLQIYATKDSKAAMTADEKAAFSAYMINKGAAGDHFQFISLAPDSLTLIMTVFYDPQILKSTGAKLSDATMPVNLASADYLNNIKYAGVFNRTKLTDAIQAADGVVDIVLGNVSLNGDLNNSREFESASGFYIAETITVTYTATNAN